MAAPTLWEVCEGIEDRLDTIPGLRTKAFAPDGDIEPPCAFVNIPEIPSYRDAFANGTSTFRYSVTVLTSSGVDRAGQKLLAELASPTGDLSVLAAIEGDTTLGGIVHQAVVDGFIPLGLVEYGGHEYYGGEFPIRVVADGNDT